MSAKIAVKARLQGHDFDLGNLHSRFPAGDPMVDQDADGYYLGIEVEAETYDDGSALMAAATHKLKIVNGAARLADGGFRMAGLTGSFSTESDDGAKHHHVVLAETVEVRSHVSGAVVVHADGSTHEVEIKPEPPRVASLAGSNAIVDEVLGLWAEPDLDWNVLWKIFEVVRDSVGNEQKMHASGLLTLQERSAFGAAANHPDVSGAAARHARMPGGPPKGAPMTLNEGQALMRRLVDAWVATLP